MASDTEITKVRIVIRHLLWQIREVRKDREAAWEWVNRFANTLQYQELEQDPDQYALAILAEARSFNDQQRRKGQMLGVRKQLAKEGVKNPTQEQLDEKWLEMYGTNQETTADASEGDGEVNPDGQQATQAEAGTPAKNSGNGGSGTSQARESRRTGGDSVRGGQRIVPPVRPLPLPSKEQLYDFARLENLDETVAREWYEMTIIERGGLHRNGSPILNWRGAVKNYCKSRQKHNQQGDEA